MNKLVFKKGRIGDFIYYEIKCYHGVESFRCVFVTTPYDYKKFRARINDMIDELGIEDSSG